MDLIVGKNYKLTKQLGSGSFGELYIGLNLTNNNQVAVKLEPIKCKFQPQLQYEAKLLAYLLAGKGKPEGFSQLYYFGKEHNYSIMVQELLGPSLEEMFQRCDKKFSLKTTAMIGIQIIQRLEHMHRNKFIHRDIKPQNFLLGTYANCDKVYIIDFGLSKKYIQKDGTHIPYKDNKTLVGTPRYASINNHLGIEQSRRDDLESVVYMLIYFLKGCLPWQNLKQEPHYKKYEKIMEKKLSVTVQNLVSGIPEELGEMLQYCRALHYTQDPNYKFLKKLLEQALLNQDNQQIFEGDKFCWEQQQKNEQIAEKREAKKVEEQEQDFFNFDNSPAVKYNSDDDCNFQQF